jgi:hypothetical protein
MKTPTKLWVTIVAAGVLLGTPSVAQDINAKGGLLGKRYAGADFTYADYKSETFDDSQSGSAIFNTPVSPRHDFSVVYDYTYTSGQSQSIKGNSISLGWLAFNRSEYGKAYFGATLGHAWDEVKTPSSSKREKDGIWSARIGLEVPFNDQTAVNCSIGYLDGFDSQIRQGTVEYRLEGSYWLSARVAGVVSAAYHQVKQAPDAGLYRVGLRFGF